jgi:hypothetical protein
MIGKRSSRKQQFRSRVVARHHSFSVQRVTAASSASAICTSCSGVSKLAPMAPITSPSTMIGSPPCISTKPLRHNSSHAAQEQISSARLNAAPAPPRLRLGPPLQTIAPAEGVRLRRTGRQLRELDASRPRLYLQSRPHRRRGSRGCRLAIPNVTSWLFVTFPARRRRRRSRASRPAPGAWRSCASAR